MVEDGGCDAGKTGAVGNQINEVRGAREEKEPPCARLEAGGFERAHVKAGQVEDEKELHRQRGDQELRPRPPGHAEDFSQLAGVCRQDNGDRCAQGEPGEPAPGNRGQLARDARLGQLFSGKVHVPIPINFCACSS